MAHITVEQQQVAIQTLLATVSGITTVKIDLPEAVKAEDLPMLILMPKEATYDRRSDGTNGYRVRRRWSLLLLVLAAAQGREFYSDQAVKPFLTSVPELLAAYPQIKVENKYVFNLDLHQGSDRGADPLVYKKQSYAATAFTFFTEIVTAIKAIDM
jgi:hypothetical protein